MAEAYLTVEALTKYIKRKFEADPYLRKVYVKGELSNVKLHSSGHLYFTLKDEKAQIKGIMYARNAEKIKFHVENGMNVLVEGDINVYERGGSYQFYATTLEPDGVGSLYLAFEQLKEQLTKEGIFEQRFKQPIAKYPRAIGVVTAITGAAVRDICTTLQRHYSLATVYIFPTLVQGERAAKSIVQSIRQANTMNDIDTLIIGRGGGSIEDLWAFNEEIVARAIFESRIPIISGVGHETDTTIADFAADLRAPTPTGAAKMAVPDVLDLQQYVRSLEMRVVQTTRVQLERAASRLKKVTTSYPMMYPERLYRPFEERLARLEQQQQRAYERRIAREQQRLARLESSIMRSMPLQQVQYEAQRLANLERRLAQATTQLLKRKQRQFDTMVRTMSALNPLSVMERGYSIVYNKQREVIASTQQVVEGETLTIAVADGQITATVLNIIQKEEE